MEAALHSLPWGNPASPHSEGRQARAALDRARDACAAALGVEARELAFTSGGTEACSLALLGAGRRLPKGRRLVTWAAEHQAVLGPLRQLELEGRPLTVLPAGPGGRAASAAIPADAGLVSIGLANNEVGTVQPVAEVAAAARERGALVHLDACQGAQWLRPELGLADLASFSGHKLGAGTGGLLWAREGLLLEPLQYGGPQEFGRRPGREDVASAVAVAAALTACAGQRARRAAEVAPLGARLQALLAELGGRPTGAEPRLPGLASAAFAGVRGEDLVLALDLAGIAASSGSACASGSLDPSHVLLALGLSLEESLGSLRLSLGYGSSGEEVERALPILRRVLEPVLARG